MANVEHSVLTGSALHEPKGASTATSGEVYVANGSGSGVWQTLNSYASVATNFNSGGAYTLDTDVGEKFVSFTPAQTQVQGFTVGTSPNFRVTSDIPSSVQAYISFSISVRNESQGSRTVEWALFKNGVEISGSRTTLGLIGSDPDFGSSGWSSATLQAMTTLAENDYIEIKSKASANNVEVQYANLQLSIIGMRA